MVLAELKICERKTLIVEDIRFKCNSCSRGMRELYICSCSKQSHFYTTKVKLEFTIYPSVYMLFKNLIVSADVVKINMLVPIIYCHVSSEPTNSE